MKKLIIAAFISLVAIGAASADYYSDIQPEQVNLTNLPATAADRTSQSSSNPTQDSLAHLFPGADLR